MKSLLNKLRSVLSGLGLKSSNVSGGTWRPFTAQELKREIASGESAMNSEEMELWKKLRMTPEKWKQEPWGNEGGGFWVVAVSGDQCLYYNDIEEGFNWSTFKTRGVIDAYWCDQHELDIAIRRKLRGIEGPRGGPPVPFK